MKKNIKKLIMELKITFLLIILSISNILARNSYSQAARISLEMKGATLEQVMDEIERQSDFYFIFNQKQIDVDRIVDIKAENEPITDILPELFKDEKINYAILNRKILLTTEPLENNLVSLSIKNEPPQQITVTGKVTDSQTGEPMAGVNVVVKGTTIGTMTDASGNYSLNVPDRNATLVFSFIGYGTQEIPVEGRTTINVSLKSETIGLEEVVVTALGIKKQTKALSYSVTEVKGDDVQKVPEINLMNTLQGKIAGVDINISGTGAAGSSNVRIRGNTSISRDNNPLYVVDGIPISRASSSYGGRDLGDALTTINPNDIETMSVLKGAAATALYGSRASNGVILITTKSGAGQRGIGISYNGSFAIENYVNPYRNRQKLYGNSGMNGDNSDTYPTTWNQEVHRQWGPKYDGRDLGIYFNDNPNIPIIFAYKEDHWDEFMRTGSTITNDLSFTGGSQNQRFRASVSDMRYVSPLPNSNMNRQTVNLSLNSKFGKRINLEARAAYTTSKSKNRPNPQRYVQILSLIPTNWDITWLKGDTEKWGAKPDGWMLPFSTNDYYQNPYWSAYQDSQNDQRDRVMANANLRYDITDWLFLNGRIGIENSSLKVTNIDAYGFLRGNVNGTGAVTEFTTIENQFNAEYSLNFNKQFGGFNITAMFGGSLTRSNYNRDGIRGDQLLVPFYHVITNAGQLYTDVGYSRSGINSLYGSAEASYKDLVYLTLTGRNDWFSTLAPENNSIFYPSVGISYLLHNQIKLPDWWSFAKIRASYAEVGGGSSAYSTKIGYNFDQTGYMGTPLISIPNNIANPNLLPYETREYEVGVDFRFLQNRVAIDYSYYDKKTTNDIVGVTLPQSSGYTSATVNLGAIGNKGHELMLTLVPIAREVNLELNLVYSYNMGKILDLGGVSEVSAGSTSIGGGIDVKQVVGQRPFAMYGYTQKEVDGKPVWERWSFNYAGQTHLSWRPVRDPQKTLIGYGTYPNSASFTATLRWKNFNFSAVVDGKWGATVAYVAEQEMVERGQSTSTLPGRDGGLFLEGVYNTGTSSEPVWTDISTATGYTINANPANNLPNPVEVAGNEIPYHVKHFENYYREGFTKRVCEMVVFNADYAKFRQFTLGYTIPKSLYNNIPVQNINVSIIGRNLFDLLNHLPNGDPGTGSATGINNYALPSTRTFTLNVSANF
ncbi:MAG TPA: SusC/RagA family TonB-linked outer membrane protein [Bacteroidales bacterium]|nr:SusC/RagA family TonB-linked outer membrane protein [Bacteroidales bacterium]HQG52108.1 SusC/RagA family TonB-linked outer membrane protein [Bacteroidales bacterium]